MEEKIRHLLRGLGLIMIPVMIGGIFLKDLSIFWQAGFLGTVCLLGSLTLKK